MNNNDIIYGTAESVMTALEKRAVSYYEKGYDDGTNTAFHDSLVAVVADGEKFEYHEGYTMGGQMRPCTRDEAKEVIEAYGICEEGETI